MKFNEDLEKSNFISCQIDCSRIFRVNKKEKYGYFSVVFKNKLYFFEFDYFDFKLLPKTVFEKEQIVVYFLKNCNYRHILKDIDKLKSLIENIKNLSIKDIG